MSSEGPTSFIEVSNQLIEVMGDEWSDPVEFRFHRIDHDRVDMSFRYTDEGLMIRRMREILTAAWEAYLEGTPETLDEFERLYTAWRDSTQT